MLSTTNPEEQARAVMLIFNTENPLAKQLNVVTRVVENLYQLQTNRLHKPIEFGVDEKKKVFKNLSYFLTEIGFSAEASFFNAWGYCQFMCQALMSFLDKSAPTVLNSTARNCLIKDLFKLAQINQVFFPPQMLFILNEIHPAKNEHFFETYQTNLGLALNSFYSEPNNSLADISTTYSVTGLNRPLANPNILSKVSGSGIGLILFAGPPPYAEKRVERVEKLTGHKLLVYAVDKQSPQDLRRRSIVANNELMPGQHPDEIFAERKAAAKQKGTYLALKIPDDLNQLDDNVDFNLVRFVDCSRGSLLYFPPEELIEYLTWLFSKVKPGTVIFLSKGISQNIITDIGLRKKEDGSLEILASINGLDLRKEYREISRSVPNVVQKVFSKRTPQGMADYYQLFLADNPIRQEHDREFITKIGKKWVCRKYPKLLQEFFDQALPLSFVPRSTFIATGSSTNYNDAKQLKNGARIKNVRGAFLEFLSFESYIISINQRVIFYWLRLMLEGKTELAMVFLDIIQEIVNQAYLLASNEITRTEYTESINHIENIEKFANDKHKSIANIFSIIEEIHHKLFNAVVFKRGNQHPNLIPIDLLAYFLKDIDLDMFNEIIFETAANMNATTAAQGVLYPDVVRKAWKDVRI